MLLVPPIVDLGFLYPMLSEIFYRCYSLKNLRSGIVEVAAITRSTIADDLKV